MFRDHKGSLPALIRNILIALVLASGLVPAANSEEVFYYLQPQTAALSVPEAPAPAAVKNASRAGYLSQSELQIDGFPAPPGLCFMRASDQAALNRVIGGVHHPTDVEAGKQPGNMVFLKMQQNPSFAADEEALLKYLR